MGKVHTGKQVGLKPFAAINDDFLLEIDIADDQEFFGQLSSEDFRLIELTMLNSTGLDLELMEAVTYNSITANAAYIVGEFHPLSIVTEGAWLEENSDSQNYLGNKIYTRFKALIEKNNPMYAAITLESSLECPTDLATDPRSNAFQDFYVSTNYFSHSDFKTY